MEIKFGPTGHVASPFASSSDRFASTPNCTPAGMDAAGLREYKLLPEHWKISERIPGRLMKMGNDSSDEAESGSVTVGKEPPAAKPAEAIRWVAVNTHAHREHIALENLVRQHFEVYCPMIRRRVRHARRVSEVLRPLFPGYVFTQIDMDLQRWRPILSTYGVRALVRCGDQLSFVDSGFVESLKAREVQGAIVKPPQPYKPGQQIRMSGGPFDGLVATIIEMDEKDRLLVLMELLNQSVKVKVSASDVSGC